jgi:hypothetical protein
MIAIQTPVDGASFGLGAVTIFSATAVDSEDGNLSNRIVWTSSVQGRIGVGSTVTGALSAGTHVITATVTDNAGNSRSARVAITITK